VRVVEHDDLVDDAAVAQRHELLEDRPDRRGLVARRQQDRDRVPLLGGHALDREVPVVKVRRRCQSTALSTARRSVAA
jgi:hypothetical protein